MKLPLRVRRAALGLGGLLSIALVHLAGAQAIDPPGRVARLAYTEGEVTLASAGSEEWAPAVLNRPLTSADKLWVDTDARAELQVGSATIHLDHETSFSFLELDDDVMQMSLTGGTAMIRVRQLAEGETIQVETPNVSVFLHRPGEYQVQVDTAADQTVVKTRSGEAEAVGGSSFSSYRVSAGQEGAFSGFEELKAQIEPLAPRTAFESWADERNRRQERSVSARHVSPGVIGYQDLDEHGEWIHEREYGYVWRPLHVAFDWAPYRYGRWTWIGPWGWTWIDDAHWGFAPFHYGRWAHVRNRWCWVPGRRRVRPIYAPALVAWTGGPAGGVALSFGRNVGWYPLAPHEVFVPGYRHTPRYIRNVNASTPAPISPSQIANIYAGRNRNWDYQYSRRPHAVTVARHDQFIGGASIGGQRVHMNNRDLRGWRDNARPPGIAPAGGSALAGASRGTRPDGGSAFFGENPKGSGDFRAVGPRTASGDSKRGRAQAMRADDPLRRDRWQRPPVKSFTTQPQIRDERARTFNPGAVRGSRPSGREASRELMRQPQRRDAVPISRPPTSETRAHSSRPATQGSSPQRSVPQRSTPQQSTPRAAPRGANSARQGSRTARPQ